jgi:DNA-binding ferritin-like protein
MKKLHEKALKAYIDMLQIHIDTKTSDERFHEMTEWFYEFLFKIAHEIWEKHVDLGWNILENSLEDKKIEANNIIVNLRKEIESYVENNELTLGTEDLFAPFANELESMEWSSRAFL